MQKSGGRARNLLLCFDAFGTLFKPQPSIFEQYGDVARKLGLSGFSDDDVAKSFKQAFKHECKVHPNYGKASGIKAATWWTSIIRNTFKPLLPPSQSLPEDLAPQLLHRFSSKEGYVLFPDVLPFLEELRKARLRHVRSEDVQTVVGIITNSDDRVPGILESLGLKVDQLRFGQDVSAGQAGGEVDIDFVVMSYDVGFEKPHRRMFDAATETLRNLLAVRSAAHAGIDSWDVVYVGDELEKDVLAAEDAGWSAALLDREGRYSDQTKFGPTTVTLDATVKRSVLVVKDLEDLRKTTWFAKVG
ncbi:hypothetical protein LTR66_004866 [Elasticomyces elasticus]|nr:hypothetical protein LTR66_004866 [Elasticomyces elasticus]